MNSKQTDTIGKDHGGNGNDTVARLLRLAGEPESIPEHRVARVRAQVQDHWQRQVVIQRRSRWVQGLAVAASVVLMLGASWRFLMMDPEVAVTVARVQGSLMVDEAPSPVGTGVQVGQIIATTADSRASLAWSSGHDLRLDRSTRIEITGEREMALVQGRIYIDSGTGIEHAGSITVLTDLGPVRDIGTQFEVTRMDDALSVRVREGLVEVTDARHAVEAGYRLDLAQNDTEPTRQAIDTHGEDWDWTYQAGAPFEVEGRSLDEFLRWITRQNGWDLAYDSLRIRRTAEDTRVRGSIAGLDARQALESVLRTYGFDFQLEAGTLHIQESSTGGR